MWWKSSRGNVEYMIRIFIRSDTSGWFLGLSQAVWRVRVQFSLKYSLEILFSEIKYFRRRCRKYDENNNSQNTFICNMRKFGDRLRKTGAVLDNICSWNIFFYDEEVVIDLNFELSHDICDFQERYEHKSYVFCVLIFVCVIEKKK